MKQRGKKMTQCGNKWARVSRMMRMRRKDRRTKRDEMTGKKGKVVYKLKEIDLFIESVSNNEWIVCILFQILYWQCSVLLSSVLLSSQFVCSVFVETLGSGSPRYSRLPFELLIVNTMKCLPFSSNHLSTLLKVTFCICLQFSSILLRECRAPHCCRDGPFFRRYLLSVIWFIVCIFFLRSH